jgi:hypothetical protein
MDGYTEMPSKASALCGRECSGWASVSAFDLWFEFAEDEKRFREEG